MDARQSGAAGLTCSHGTKADKLPIPVPRHEVSLSFARHNPGQSPRLAPPARVPRLCRDATPGRWPCARTRSVTETIPSVHAATPRGAGQTRPCPHGTRTVSQPVSAPGPAPLAVVGERASVEGLTWLPAESRVELAADSQWPTASDDPVVAHWLAKTEAARRELATGRPRLELDVIATRPLVVHAVYGAVTPAEESCQAMVRDIRIVHPPLTAFRDRAEQVLDANLGYP